MSQRSKRIRAAKAAKKKARQKAILWRALCAASWDGGLMVCSHGGIAVEHPHAYGLGDGSGDWMYVDLNEHMQFGGSRHDYGELAARRLTTILDPGRWCGPTLIDLYDRGLTYEALRGRRRSKAPALSPRAWAAFPPQRRCDPWLDGCEDHTPESLEDFASGNLGRDFRRTAEGPLDFMREANAAAMEAHRAGA